MGSSTSPDSLYKPNVGEEGWGNAVNANMDTIQARLTELADAVAALQPPLPSETFFSSHQVSIVANAGVHRYNGGGPNVGGLATDLNTSDYYWCEWIDPTTDGFEGNEDWIGTVPLTPADTAGYWATNVPAYSYVVVPKGRYMGFVQATVSADAVAAKQYLLGWDFVSNIRYQSPIFEDYFQDLGAVNTSQDPDGRVSVRTLDSGWTVFEVPFDDTPLWTNLGIPSGAGINGTVTNWTANLQKVG